MTDEFLDVAMGHVTIGDVSVHYKEQDAGGRHYLNRTHFEERISPLYRLLVKSLMPKVCVDVGANYGVTGLFMARSFPQARIRMVEPVPWLEPFIRYNFLQNGEAFDQLHSAIVSTPQEGTVPFGVNTKATQDSRVIAQLGFDQVDVHVISLDELCADIQPHEGVFIKIDTQGWEESVFASGRDFLSSHKRWFIKTEFAPSWLRSQGTDPVSLLGRLASEYFVFEHPGRIAWTTRDLAQMLGRAVLPGQAKDFVEYVQSMAMNGRGWTDLFVLPKAAFEPGGYVE